jgi:hypothetical protein
MTSHKKSRTKQELILEVWEQSGSQSAGVAELSLIQQALEESFQTVESPASLARTLADDGVPLRHPEVLEADSAWRENWLSELLGPEELNFKTVDGAIASMARFEQLRSQFLAQDDRLALQSLVEQAREVRAELSHQATDLSKESVQWLTLWLQNPQIFDDWLSLRRNSPEFLRKFS